MNFELNRYMKNNHTIAFSTHGLRLRCRTLRTREWPRRWYVIKTSNTWRRHERPGRRPSCDAHSRCWLWQTHIDISPVRTHKSYRNARPHTDSRLQATNLDKSAEGWTWRPFREQEAKRSGQNYTKVLLNKDGVFINHAWIEGALQKMVPESLRKRIQYHSHYSP